jgi:uncharacterized small protein (DUF1192 family)
VAEFFVVYRDIRRVLLVGDVGANSFPLWGTVTNADAGDVVLWAQANGFALVSVERMDELDKLGTYLAEADSKVSMLKSEIARLEEVARAKWRDCSDALNLKDQMIEDLLSQLDTFEQGEWKND